MSGILQELDSIIGNPASRDDEGRLAWKLSKRLAKKDSEFFLPLIKNHLELNLRYTVICAQLARDFARKKNGNYLDDEEREALTKQIVDALRLAELLTSIYVRLNIPREIERLKNEQEIYRVLLEMRNYSFPHNSQKNPLEASSSPSENIKNYLETSNWPESISAGLKWAIMFLAPLIDYLGVSFSQKIRSLTLVLNFPRLLLVRNRRILMTLRPLLEHVKNYTKFIALVDPFIGPVLNYFSWIFYIPRLAVNLYLILKHVIPGWWLSDEEKQLEWTIRLQMQFQRRWFELLNDVPWIIGGLLGCFLLVGAMSNAGMYLTIALFFYDVILAGVRAYIELGRLDKLLVESEEIAKTNNPAIAEEIENYQESLKEWQSYEQKRMWISIVSTIALFVGMLFAIPAITNPIVPVVGACLVVFITVITYLAGNWLERQRPSTKVDKAFIKEGRCRFDPSPEYAKARFFSQNSSEDSELYSSSEQECNEDEDSNYIRMSWSNG